MENETRKVEPQPDGLAALREEMRNRQAPPSVERALLREFRARHGGRGSGIRWWRAAAGLAAAAAIVVTVLALRPRPSAPAERASQEIATDYIPIGFGQPLSSEDFAQVVRVSMPTAEMAQFGLPVAPGNVSDRVMADVVFGEDGIAKAIRFVDQRSQR